MPYCSLLIISVFFFNDTATTEIYTLSLHDALPIFMFGCMCVCVCMSVCVCVCVRSEEHTSELQSHLNLVCRLLLEKKKRSVCLRCSPGVCLCLTRTALLRTHRDTAHTRSRASALESRRRPSRGPCAFF